jgi:hypothetical protein
LGAGDRQEHHAQDSAEAYLVWRLQYTVEQEGRALSRTSEHLKEAFDTYVDSRQARAYFDASDYKQNIDAVVADVVAKVISHYKDDLIEFVDVEKEYRDQKKKGDFEIRFQRNRTISVSVKNYKNGFKRIQLCSGTWNSFLNNFIFEPDGVGTFLDPFTGKRFSGSDRTRRDQLVGKMGLHPLLEIYKFIDDTNDEIRAFYADSDRARMWNEVADRWKSDCVEYGSDAANRLCIALKSIHPELVKQRLLSMAGLTFAEELLLLGRGQYLFSLVHRGYRTLLEEANDADTTVDISSKGQTLRLSLISSSGTKITDIEVPFTLQKNGAWHLPREEYSGKQMHHKEGVPLAYGERRPRKSRELATSTNTYLDLARLGLA